VTFERGQEGLYGVCDFAGLLERAAAMEAISEDAAEEADATSWTVRKLAEGENQEAMERRAEEAGGGGAERCARLGSEGI